MSDKAGDSRRLEPGSVAERPVGLVRGTREWLPNDFARLAAIEHHLVQCFTLAGYQPIRTPILEFTDLHERKSGAGIVSKLFELAVGGASGICLRPELTASIVRAYTEAPEGAPVPWRVSSSGPVFRYESDPRGGRLREFTQVGVELIGAPGPAADAEVIGLADKSLASTGITDATIRIGHVGLILEILGHAGLPPSARSALVEMLSAAAADGKGVESIGSAIERLAGWLKSGAEAEAIMPAVSNADERGVDRLFRHLVPNVTGRRSGHEIINRLRGKWDLDHSLSRILENVRDQFQGLADLRGPAPVVLERLSQNFANVAPHSIADLKALVEQLATHGVRPARVELDLAFGRGIGFYTQMIFELVVATPEGTVEVCGGGRYDGLARVLGSDRDDRGVGFAFGLERLVETCTGRGVGPQPAQTGAIDL